MSTWSDHDESIGRKGVLKAIEEGYVHLGPALGEDTAKSIVRFFLSIEQRCYYFDSVVDICRATLVLVLCRVLTGNLSSSICSYWYNINKQTQYPSQERADGGV